MIRALVPIILGPLLCWTIGFDLHGSADRQTKSPCQIDGEGYDELAFARFRAVLADSGETGEHFAPMRKELGIVGVKIGDLVVVTDTTKCRRAITAWKAHYSTLGPDYADMATYVRGGLLVRMSSNRYSLAVAVFDQYSGATFFVTDSNFVMVKPFM
ncbi:MAG: hypothetical protein K2R93_19360 [Gemmatimonadaceae bacterium]|nr:hypothetical protein [Gemmatimonadaceae bacterium]